MGTGKLILLSGAAVAVLLLAGCSSIVNAHSQKSEMMANYVNGQQKLVLQELDHQLRESRWYNSSKEGTGDEVMWRLEAGSMNFIAGNDEKCIRHLERAEQLIEDFDERAVVNLREAGAESGALLTNPNALPYRGWCRDRIMLPVFKAFAYLGKADESGFQVELNRLRSNQDQVMDDYRKFFEEEEKALKRERSKNRQAAGSVDMKRMLSRGENRELSGALAETSKIAHRGFGNFLNPFAIFMSAYGYVRSGSWQNAIVDYERLYKAMPDHPSVRQYYVTALTRTGREIPADLKSVQPFDFPLDQQNVLVIFANGRSAALRQIALYIPIIIPRYATLVTVAWPVGEFYPASRTALTAEAGGRKYQTSVLADMDGILAAEYDRRLPGMLVRICLNTAIKEIGAYAATRAAAGANEYAGLAVGISAAAYKAVFNTADTRTWEILPKEIQVVQFPVPADRKLILSPGGGNPLSVQLPETAGSFIVYVNAPGGRQDSLSYRIFNLKK